MGQQVTPIPGEAPRLEKNDHEPNDPAYLERKAASFEIFFQANLTKFRLWKLQYGPHKFPVFYDIPTNGWYWLNKTQQRAFRRGKLKLVKTVDANSLRAQSPSKDI
jgi:hypothetical protein